MSIRGVWQLKNLRLSFCKIGGSSRGIRELILAPIEQFKKDNPQLNVEIRNRNGHHPYVRGEYLTGYTKTISVRNKSVKEIMEVIKFLRSSNGGKSFLWTRVK
eukprot:TRINITY_DN7862_c0_g1_i1.p1 TRINITY_DN7862_c0_g1~~TRINITY_DN7862_c0_g1_i1.p1  ORF type:complete len:103 (-),score=7.12 TRINITY_DN7862_c0_g1_i1:170-478(-)